MSTECFRPPLLDDPLMHHSYNQAYSSDPVVKIFDISGKKARLVFSKVFEYGPRFVRFMPTHGSCNLPDYLIASAGGFVRISRFEPAVTSDNFFAAEEVTETFDEYQASISNFRAQVIMKN